MIAASADVGVSFPVVKTSPRELGGWPRPKDDTINIADRKIKHHSLAASQVTSSRLQTLATFAPG